MLSENITQIKLCNEIYDIIFIEKDNEILKDDNGEYYGKIYFTEKKIYINKDTTKLQQIKTLFHEILHAYAFEMKYFTDEGYSRMEEMILGCYTTGLIDLFVNNKFVLETIKEEING